MGGGGGGSFFGKRKPKDLSRKVRDSERGAIDSEFESQVNSLLGSALVDFNERDTDAVNRHLDAIRGALEREIEGTVDLIFGGSVSKHTYVDGLSDIDSLVILNKSELKNLKPLEIMEYFLDCLRDRFPETQIEKGILAVTLKFKDIDIQLLPALKTKTGFKIADSSGSKWASIDPEEFSGNLTKVNEISGRKLVPIIKLAKAINNNLPAPRRLQGYHLEAIAVKIFESYSGPNTHKAMLQNLFTGASKSVLRPIADKSGQSNFVDDYLGKENSTSRRLVADALARIARQMHNADGARSLQMWGKIIGQ